MVDPGGPKLIRMNPYKRKQRTFPTVVRGRQDKGRMVSLCQSPLCFSSVALTSPTMREAEYRLLRDTHSLVPRARDCVVLHGKKDFRWEMEFTFANVLTFK